MLYRLNLLFLSLDPAALAALWLMSARVMGAMT